MRVLVKPTSVVSIVFFDTHVWFGRGCCYDSSSPAVGWKTIGIIEKSKKEAKNMECERRHKGCRNLEAFSECGRKMLGSKWLGPNFHVHTIEKYASKCIQII